MLPSNNIQSIVGAILYGRDNARIGRIDQVLVDAATGQPTWAVLHGGIFGRKTLFVPLDGATWEHDDVFVELEKDDVKNAPHPDAEGGLSPAEEQELRDYYAGRRDDGDQTATATRVAPEAAEPAPVPVPDSVDRTDAATTVDPSETDDGPKHAADADAPDADESVVLVQERLVVRTEQVPVARVNLDAIDDVDAADAPRADATTDATADATTDPTSDAATDAPRRDDDPNPDDNRPGPNRIVI